MSLHKLTAGSGYDYLTRQVAALDATEKGHTGLASYYTERGETPGVWVGSGMDGIDGQPDAHARLPVSLRRASIHGIHRARGVPSSKAISRQPSGPVRSP